ncbi:response regulator [Bosea lathyri]|uniref:Response regulator receiver domain-containing protein n=1 Tax=Bosea lathyri TaxID=1036778 RepID=A0A1H5XET8_9HYPH|nr:response regulator [Bosea lathyri]SEG10324.1 Response regulator receiver domain-containing protein [Bosea lathyri]
MRSPKHQSILILEAQPIVAIDLEATLSDAGFNVAHVATTCRDAMTWLAENAPDLVVLDIQLADGDCTEVALALVERHIPFVVFTGSNPNDRQCSPVFSMGHWVEKPSPTEAVAEAFWALSSADNLYRQRA